MRDWASVRDRSAAALGLEWEPLTEEAAAEIDGFLDFNRASFLQQPEAVPDGGRFSDWLRETFEVLERWSDAGEAQADYALLDRVRGALDALAPHSIPQRDTQPRRERRRGARSGGGVGRPGGIGRLRREVRRLTTAQAETQKQAAERGRRLSVSKSRVEALLLEREGLEAARAAEAESARAELEAVKQALAGQKAAAARVTATLRDEAERSRICGSSSSAPPGAASGGSARGRCA